MQDEAFYYFHMVLQIDLGNMLHLTCLILGKLCVPY